MEFESLEIKGFQLKNSVETEFWLVICQVSGCLAEIASIARHPYGQGYIELN